MTLTFAVHTCMVGTLAKSPSSLMICAIPLASIASTASSSVAGPPHLPRSPLDASSGRAEGGMQRSRNLYTSSTGASTAAYQRNDCRRKLRVTVHALSAVGATERSTRPSQYPRDTPLTPLTPLMCVAFRGASWCKLSPERVQRKVRRYTCSTRALRCTVEQRRSEWRGKLVRR